MRVLVACEYSGRVRQAFRAKGHDAWSCDLLDSEDDTTFHFKGDMFEFIEQAEPFDLLIAHPPCTYLTSAGLFRNNGNPERQAATEEAIAFCKSIMALPIPKKAMENPIGRLSTAFRKPTQIIQPYQFGENASKSTCLWLEGLPPLVGTLYCPGREVGVNKRGQPVYRWDNQTDSGQNRLGPSPDRWKERSRTYQGIADAMAAQWG